jgi:hypothetical protein
LIELPATIEALGPFTLHVTTRRRLRLDAFQITFDHSRGGLLVRERHATRIAHRCLNFA